MRGGVETCGRRRGVLECSKWIVPRIVDVLRESGESDVLVIVAREPQRDVMNVTRHVDVLGVRTGLISRGHFVLNPRGVVKANPGGMVVTVGHVMLKWTGDVGVGVGMESFDVEEIDVGVKVISFVNFDALVGERKVERFCWMSW